MSDFKFAARALRGPLSHWIDAAVRGGHQDRVNLRHVLSKRHGHRAAAAEALLREHRDNTAGRQRAWARGLGPDVSAAWNRLTAIKNDAIAAGKKHKNAARPKALRLRLSRMISDGSHPGATSTARGGRGWAVPVGVGAAIAAGALGLAAYRRRHRKEEGEESWRKIAQ